MVFPGGEDVPNRSVVGGERPDREDGWVIVDAGQARDMVLDAGWWLVKCAGTDRAE